MHIALVTCLDCQLRIAAHEVRGHRHLRAVGQHGMRVIRKLLDKAEDVVPPPAIQSRRMVAQLVENFIHLKTSQNRLNQHSALDASLRHTKLMLRADEDLVPEACFKMALDFWQVEIRATPTSQQLFRVMKEVEAEIENGA